MPKCNTCKINVKKGHIFCIEHAQKSWAQRCYYCNLNDAFDVAFTYIEPRFGVAGSTNPRWSQDGGFVRNIRCKFCRAQVGSYEWKIDKEVSSESEIQTLMWISVCLMWGSFFGVVWEIISFKVMIITFPLMLLVFFWGKIDTSRIQSRERSSAWVEEEINKHAMGHYFISEWDKRVTEAHDIRPIDFDHLFKKYGATYPNLPTAKQICYNAGIMFEGNVDWRMEEKLKAYNNLITLQKGAPKLSKNEHLHIVNYGTRFVLMSKKSLLEKYMRTIPINKNMSKIELVRTIMLHKKINQTTKASLLEEYEHLSINKSMKKKEIIQVVIESHDMSTIT
jgi:hypothetical protein